jgi:hypothetical protein
VSEELEGSMRRYLVGMCVLALVVGAGRGSAGAAPRVVSSGCVGAVGWQSASRVVGRVATIRGRVAGTRYAVSSNGSPTFLNIGVDYPNPRRFTVVIWQENRATFGRPETRYLGKTVCVRGLVARYAGVAEIEARSSSQISIAR